MKCFFPSFLKGTTLRAEYFQSFPSKLCALCALCVRTPLPSEEAVVAFPGPLGNVERMPWAGMPGPGWLEKYISIRPTIAVMSCAMNPRRAAIVLTLQADVRGR